MSDATRRGIRTAAQLLIALAGVFGPLVALAGVPAATVVAIGGALTAAGAVITLVMNALEDAGIIPPLLKPVSSKSNTRSGRAHPTHVAAGDVMAGATGTIATGDGFTGSGGGGGSVVIGDVPPPPLP